MLLFSGSWHRRLVVRIRGKPSFFVRCGAAFVAPPCAWLVHMTCRLYGSQNSKKSRRNSLFPDASRMIFSRNRAPVASPAYSVPMHTANCRAHALEVRQLWLNLQRENIFRQHIYSYYCWLCHILPRRNRTTKPTQNKIALVERERARNFLIFCSRCKYQTLGCKRLELKWRINFSTRQTFPPHSFPNSYFLYWNFAVRDFSLFTLDFNT